MFAVFVVAFLPGILERGYPRHVGMYVQVTAWVILMASAAYWAVLLGRLRRAEGLANRAAYRETTAK